MIVYGNECQAFHVGFLLRIILSSHLELQASLLQKYAGEDGSDEKESMLDAASSAVPSYHYLLMNFLDNEAPVLTGKLTKYSWSGNFLAST